MSTIEMPTTEMSTADLATMTNLPTDVVLEILDSGLFGSTVHMVHGKPVYSLGAIEVIRNVTELAEEVAASRCSAFAAWFLLRYGLKPEAHVSR